MIDGTREGEMNAAYMLRVDEPGYFCLIAVECMHRANRDLKIMFVDCAAHNGWGGAEGAYLISCVASQL